MMLRFNNYLSKIANASTCDLIQQFQTKNWCKLFYQSNEKRRAIEEHVKRVGNESERVGQESVEQLDEGERQVHAQEAQQVPGVSVRNNQTKPEKTHI